jgi:plastocyanin
MRARWVAALGAGFLTAVAVASLPAAASDATVAATGQNRWSPDAVTIAPGEQVTWSNTSGVTHNIIVQGETLRDGANWSVSKTFPTAGTYTFYCSYHGGMTGTVTVTNPATGTGTSTGTGTGTSTTPPPSTQPTGTTTVPTRTEPVTTPGDTTAPAFLSAPKRRTGRRSLIVELRSSEQAKLEATVYRRPPRGRAFRRVGAASLQVKEGRNVVTLPRTARGSLRSGAYRVRLQLVDATGNKSATRTLSFRLG